MNISFKIDWLAAGQDARPESAHTTGMLAIYLNELSLTEAEDVWSKTIRPSVLVSAYPLAMWLAASWWRLNWEPLPARHRQPNVDWRMCHEIGAANEGYVWPQVIFASDGRTIQTWAIPSTRHGSQSLRYLNGLALPESIPIVDFQRRIDEFISVVTTRLDAMDCGDSDLAQLWKLIQEDRANPETHQYRKLEAQMGWDPDECPEAFMNVALELNKKLGDETLSELAPIYSQSLNRIAELGATAGLLGNPSVPEIAVDTSPYIAPWKAAVAAARELRRASDSVVKPMSNQDLCSLLGIKTADFEGWSPRQKEEATLGIPLPGQQYKFSLRKLHPIAKRFELARVLGDFILTRHRPTWLASTELPTYRQKFQKAFAAEFLSPIRAIQDYLEGDYSDSAAEDAANRFEVSPLTINSSLANNGLISRYSVGYSGVVAPYEV